jgi:hypothetical protein
MGVFFESRPVEPRIRSAILESLNDTPPNADAAQSVAAQRANEVTSDIEADREFKTGRFIGALILFGVIAAIAWYAEVRELEGATEALWGIATTAFGVVLGFVGGEAASGT